MNARNFISRSTLEEIRNLDTICFGFFSEGRNIYINADVLLQIILYLDIDDILSLAFVCKTFYGLCRSNIVWRRQMFSQKLDQMLQKIYENNRFYFLSYFYFRNYVEIDYHPLEYPCNLFGLFISINNLISDLRAPYYHHEILKDVRSHYNKMVKEEPAQDKIIYTTQAVETIPTHQDSSLIWKYELVTDNCELLIIMRKNRNNEIKLKKYVKPFNVPPSMIKKKKVLLYKETVYRMFP